MTRQQKLKRKRDRNFFERVKGLKAQGQVPYRMEAYNHINLLGFGCKRSEIKKIFKW